MIAKALLFTINTQNSLLFFSVKHNFLKNFLLCLLREQPIAIRDTSMNCPNCNNIVDQNDSFCTYCGFKLDNQQSQITQKTPSMKTCPQCQQFIDEEQNFCPNCGFSFDGKPHIISSASNLEITCPNCKNIISNNNLHCPQCGFSISYKPYQPTAEGSAQYRPYTPYSSYKPPLPGQSYASLKGYQLAPLPDRIVAYCIDSIIVSIANFVCPLACLYGLFKDGMNEGRSIGKSAMGLRVINYNTGMPASYGESCIRNFCECCVCWAFIDEEHRRVGDYIASTIVIKDE